jgi:hypothetical protein
MLDNALGTGLRIASGVLTCARELARRAGTQLRPIVDLALQPLAGGEAAPAAHPEAAAHEVADSQAEVEGAKYYLGPADDRTAQPVVDREEGELPRSYGHDRIVLLPRDPWWAFAYWEVSPSTRVQALRALGLEAEGAREVLRVYDVSFITFTGDNAWLSVDIELPPGADRWYVNLARPAASFCAELGLRTPQGRFLPLARSNIIAIPPASPSPDSSVRWLHLGDGVARETAAAWTGVRLPSAEDVPGDARPRSSDLHAPPAP